MPRRRSSFKQHSNGKFLCSCHNPPREVHESNRKQHEADAARAKAKLAQRDRKPTGFTLIPIVPKSGRRKMYEVVPS